MSLDALCSTHLVDVEKFRITQDASGGSVRTKEPYLSGVSCNVQPISVREKILFGQRQAMFSHKLYFSYDPNITRDCLITVTASPDAEQVGQTFVPVGQRDMAGQGRAYVLHVVEQAKP